MYPYQPVGVWATISQLVYECLCWLAASSTIIQLVSEPLSASWCPSHYQPAGVWATISQLVWVFVLTCSELHYQPVGVWATISQLVSEPLSASGCLSVCVDLQRAPLSASSREPRRSRWTRRLSSTARRRSTHCLTSPTTGTRTTSRWSSSAWRRWPTSPTSWRTNTSRGYADDVCAWPATSFII